MVTTLFLAATKTTQFMAEEEMTPSMAVRALILLPSTAIEVLTQSPTPILQGP